MSEIFFKHKGHEVRKGKSDSIIAAVFLVTFASFAFKSFRETHL